MTDITEISIEKYKRQHPPIPYTEWNDDACVDLAAAIIQEAMRGYIGAYVHLKEFENGVKVAPRGEEKRMEQELRTNFKLAADFFSSRYFMILSLGRVSTNDIISYMNNIAEREYRKLC